MEVSGICLIEATENSLNPSGWGNKMEKEPNYEELLETWRAKNQIISKILKESKMEIIKVESSNVEAIGYDKESETLQVEFKNGGIYQYFDVPQHIFQEFSSKFSQKHNILF